MISFAKQSPDSGGLPLHPQNVLSAIEYVLVSVTVALTAAPLAHSSQLQSGAKRYHKGQRLYVPKGLNYPRQAWPVGEYPVGRKNRQWRRDQKL